MFKRSFEKFLDRPIDKPELYPYIYSISFKGLEELARKKITTVPIKCSQCGAVLMSAQLIQQDKKLGTYYKCEYCGAINVITKDQIPETLPDDIDIIIEDVKPKEPGEDTTTKVSAGEGELYISLVDVSGSMSGGKIEAVQNSLVQSIKDFKMNSPSTKYILIAFESTVHYYLRHDEMPIVFSGELLFSLQGMKEQLEKVLSKAVLGSIGEFADGWIKRVEYLKPLDMTALGPALFLGIASFDLLSKSGGRITLLTDGLANQGIGNLSGTSPGAEKFYEQMAELCNKIKIVVDVVGVSAQGDNNEMGLQTLGKLTDKTGGKLFLISSHEMEAIFTEMQKTNYLGKDVKVKIITPKNFSVKNVTGAFSSKGALKEPEINLGAVTKDRELYVELNAGKTLKEDINKEIPIQLQVEYKDNEGRKRLRVINDKVKVSDDELEFKSNYDQKLNAMLNIQAAGTEYYAGKADDSKKRLNKFKQDLATEMNVLESDVADFNPNKFMGGASYIDEELHELDLEAKEVQKAPAKSYMATKGQTRARISQDEKEERMKKKEKKV